MKNNDERLEKEIKQIIKLGLEYYPCEVRCKKLKTKEDCINCARSNDVMNESERGQFSDVISDKIIKLLAKKI